MAICLYLLFGGERTLAIIKLVLQCSRNAKIGKQNIFTNYTYIDTITGSVIKLITVKTITKQKTKNSDNLT